MLSDTELNWFIDAWKRAVVGDCRAWPSESIIAKIVKYLVRIDPSPVKTPESGDGDLMASVVYDLKIEHPVPYQCFVAYHLGVIGDRRLPRLNESKMAKELGIDKSTYWRQRMRAHDYCKKRLAGALDSVQCFSL
jgi:hypothetical protein